MQPKKAYKSNSKCPKCSKCGSHFSFINTVHICVHDGKKVYKCRIVYDMCDYVSDTMWEMKSHISANHGGKKYVFKEYHKKRYDCAFCGKLFEQNDSLKKQYVAVHEEKKVHKCSKCCSHFFETLDGKKRYICPICEKDFGREGSLKQHNADAHEEKEAFKCSKNQYKCSTCDARFFEKVIEKWPKSFKCLICGKALAKNLKKHIIRAHKGKCLRCVKK